MKPMSILAAAGIFLGLAEAKIAKWGRDNTPSWVPPKETVALEDGFDVGIMTAAPEPTADPRPDIVELLKRQDGGVNTCGYIDGVADTASAITCPTNAYCYPDNINSVIGCCVGNSCNVQTSCYDLTASGYSPGDETRTRYCSDPSAPKCAKLVYTDQYYSGYEALICDTARTTYFISYSPSVGAASDTSVDATATDETDTATEVATTKPTRVVGGFTAASSAGAGSSSQPTGSAPPSPGGSGKSSVPIAAIVGGSVGGVALIVIIVVVIIILVRRNKKQPHPISAMATPGPMTGPLSPGGSGASFAAQQQPLMHSMQAPPVQPNSSPQPQGWYTPDHAMEKGGYATVAVSVAEQQQQQPVISPVGSPAPQSPQPPSYPFSPPPPHVSPHGYSEVPASPPRAAATHHAAELPTERGHGEVRELA